MSTISNELDMLTMTAALRTPIGDLVLTACKRGFVAIEFVDVSADKDRELANVKIAADRQQLEAQLSFNEPRQGDLLTTAELPLTLRDGQSRNNLCLVLQKPRVLNQCSSGLQHHELTEEIAEILQLGLSQLTEYFEKNRTEFTLPLAADGTEFQQQVWQQLRQIPYGGHCSYGDIANAIARPKAVRAVGAANGRNPLAIVVPCHRVIGQNGSMTGYAGGLSRKIWLLNHENRIINR